MGNVNVITKTLLAGKAEMYTKKAQYTSGERCLDTPLDQSAQWFHLVGPYKQVPTLCCKFPVKILFDSREQQRQAIYLSIRNTSDPRPLLASNILLDRCN